MTTRIIKIEEVQHLTGLSKSSIRRLQDSNDFPKRIQVTEKCVGWLLEDIEEWINTRPKIRGTI